MHAYHSAKFPADHNQGARKAVARRTISYQGTFDLTEQLSALRGQLDKEET